MKSNPRYIGFLVYLYIPLTTKNDVLLGFNGLIVVLICLNLFILNIIITNPIIKHTNPNPIFWFKLKLAWYKYLLNNHIIIAENNAWIGGGINNFIYKFTK